MPRSFGPANNSPLFPIYAFLVALVPLLAAIPYGAVGFIPTALLIAVLFLMGAAGFLLSASPNYDPPKRPARFLIPFLSLLLLAWAVLQLLPLDLWPGHRVPDELTALLAPTGYPSLPSISVNVWQSVVTVLLWVGYFFLAWALSRVICSRPVRWTAVTGIVLGGTAEAAYAIFSQASTETGRMAGTFISPDAFGGFLVMTSVLTLGLFYALAKPGGEGGNRGGNLNAWLFRMVNDWRLWTRPALLLSLLLQATAIWASGSRGAAISAGVAYLVLFVWHAIESKHKLAHFIFLVVLVAGLAAFFMFNARGANVFDRLSAASVEHPENSMAMRVETWRATAGLAKAFPLGVGPGNLPAVLPVFQDAVHGRYALDHAHNDTLQFLGDLGIPGFALLTLILLAVMLRGVMFSIRRHRSSRSVWVPRGLLFALLAALLHAQVEFNLSVRPALQILFVLICTLLWCRPPRTAPPTGEPLPYPERRPLAIAGAVLACVVALLVAGASLAAAWTWRSYDASLAALDLEPDLYDWVQLPRVAQDTALPTLEEASERLPFAPVVRRETARAAVALHLSEVEAAATAMIPAPDESEFLPPPRILDPTDPDHRRYIDLATLALRADEADRLRAAMTNAAAARAMAPWDNQAMLLHAEILLRGLPMRLFGTNALDAALADLTLATTLRPNQGDNLAVAASVLSLAPHAADHRDTLLDWGQRAIRLDSSQSADVLDAWWRAHLSYDDILSLPGLPPALLWRLYRLLAPQPGELAAAAQERCLDRLEAALASDELPPDAPFWSVSRRKKYEASILRYRSQLADERLRRAVRTGNFDAISTTLESRRQAQVERFLAQFPADSSDPLRRFHLRDANEKLLLPPYGRAEWILAELDSSTSLRGISEPLQELLLLDLIAPEQFQRLQTKRFALSSSVALRDLLDARLAVRENRPADAVTALDHLASSGDLDRRLQHRLWLWLANLHDQLGQADEAERARSLAVKFCASDPDTHPATPPPPPDLPLGLSFAGGRLLLQGLSLSYDMQNDAQPIILLHFRYLGGGLPPDLRLVVRGRTRTSRPLPSSAKSIVLDEFHDAFYNHGNPALGATFVAAVPVTPRLRLADMLSIELVTARHLLPQDDRMSPLLFPLTSILP